MAETHIHADFVSGTRELAVPDFLLRSLEDLEREFAAGDMDEADYRTLRDDYTVRASEVLRAIDEQRRLVERQRPARSPWRTVASVVAVLALAVLQTALGGWVSKPSGWRRTRRSTAASPRGTSGKSPPGSRIFIWFWPSPNPRI